MELDKAEAKRNADSNLKHLELKDLKSTFDAEGRRLDDIILNKDRIIETLGLDLKREKEKIIVLTKNYDSEIGKLVNEKDHILSDFALMNNERNLMGKELSEINLIYDAERGRNAVVVSSLQE